MKKGIFHPKNKERGLPEIDFECFDGDTKKIPQNATNAFTTMCS